MRRRVKLLNVGIGSGIGSPYRLLALVLRSHSSRKLLESVPEEATIRLLFTSLSVIITVGQIVVGHGSWSPLIVYKSIAGSLCLDSFGPLYEYCAGN